MPDTTYFTFGAVSGGQNNFGGHHNTFHQVTTEARINELLAGLRGRLDDFDDPAAAGQALQAVAAEPGGAGGLQAMSRLLAAVKPGTEAVTALTALATTVHQLISGGV